MPTTCDHQGTFFARGYLQIQCSHVFNINIYIEHNQRKFSSNIYGNFEVTDECPGAVLSSCPHVIIKQEPRAVRVWKQHIEKSNNSGTREFKGENTLVRETLCFFSGKLVPGIAEVGSLFLRVRASMWESCRQKVHRTVARAQFALRNIKKE